MRQHKTAGYIGGITALIYLANQVYHSIRISKGFDFTESLLPELCTTAIVGLFLIFPALVLILSKNIKLKALWIVWMCPIVLILNLLSYYVFSDPLQSGMIILLFIVPFCIVFTVYLRIKTKQDKTLSL